MTSTKRLLLGTAAATVAATTGGNLVQAADIMVKKAPPVQYVRICDQYGAGFFQIPGSSICLQLRGQMQSDNAYQPTHDMIFVSPSKTTGVYSVTEQLANQQDNWGYEVTAKPRFDARTETSVGTLRAYVEIKIQLDAGAFNGPPGPGGADVGAGNKTELYRGYLQWAGWTIGNDESPWSKGAFKDGEVADVVTSDKASGWTANYTWTPAGPGAPPKKGSPPKPDGWSFQFGADEIFKHRASSQVGGGCRYYDLVLTAGSPAGFGSVCAADGTMSVPDFVGAIHFEADPPGKDPDFNDQWGIGMFHVAGAYHQISAIAVGGTAPGGSIVSQGACVVGIVACAFGPTLHDHGWAVQAAGRIYTPMWGGGKLGSLRQTAADNIGGNVLYGEGALEYVGIGASNGNLSAGDAYWSGGLARDDTDGRIVNNGVGGFYIDKEKALAANLQYDHVLTDCTDPVHCFTMTLEANYVWVTPGSTTQNVDWTLGGLGKARHMYLSADVSWGVSRNGTTKPVFWRIDFEAQYSKLWQDLPCNANGGVATAASCTSTALGGTQTAVPGNVSKDPSSWVWRTTITYDW
jgi:hypothetical protein